MYSVRDKLILHYNPVLLIKKSTHDHIPCCPWVDSDQVVYTLQVGQNLQQQVMQQGCRPSDILIAQGQVSRGGVPRFSVTVFNSCLDDKCSISQIILNCGDFAGITNPAVFRRLQQPGTCLVNDGRNLQSGSSVTFDYSQEYMEPLSVRSADVSCSRS